MDALMDMVAAPPVVVPHHRWETLVFTVYHMCCQLWPRGCNIQSGCAGGGADLGGSIVGYGLYFGAAGVVPLQGCDQHGRVAHLGATCGDTVAQLQDACVGAVQSWVDALLNMIVVVPSGMGHPVGWRPFSMWCIWIGDYGNLGTCYTMDVVGVLHPCMDPLPDMVGPPRLAWLPQNDDQG